jgi:hypothetical protein
MRRWFVLLAATLAVAAGLTAPAASAEGTPIGNLGDTLRVNFKGIVADVTVHDVLPVDPPPPGYVANGSPRWINQGGPWKAPITIHTIQAPNPYAMALAFTFTGVTPYADAYVSKHTDAPDALESAMTNAPPGSTVNGAVYWQVYRALVTNVVLLNPQTGDHLAQWNIWQPGAPLP